MRGFCILEKKLSYFLRLQQVSFINFWIIFHRTCIGFALLSGGFGGVVASRTAYAASIEEGQNAEKRGDFDSALRIYRELADRGVSAAQGQMARLTLYGCGSKFHRSERQIHPHDQSLEALRWARLGAAQNDRVSQYVIGVLYHRGAADLGRHDKDAARWFSLAAQQGYARAMVFIGLYYRNGTGVPRDLEKAERWLGAAVATGMFGTRPDRPRDSNWPYRPLDPFSDHCYSTTVIDLLEGDPRQHLAAVRSELGRMSALERAEEKERSLAEFEKAEFKERSLPILLVSLGIICTIVYILYRYFIEKLERICPSCKAEDAFIAVERWQEPKSTFVKRKDGNITTYEVGVAHTTRVCQKCGFRKEIKSRYTKSV